MKVYGTHICIDCRNFLRVQKHRSLAVDFIEITQDTGKLKEFLALRDTDPIFAPVRARGGIGVPLFVHEDGRKTFDLNEALAWMGQPPVSPAEWAACGCEGEL